MHKNRYRQLRLVERIEAYVAIFASVTSSGSDRLNLDHLVAIHALKAPPITVGVPL